MKTPSSSFPIQQKINMFLLFAIYFAISIFNTIKVFFIFSDLEEDMLSLFRNCNDIRGKILGTDKDLDNYKKCLNDFSTWGIIQGIAMIILLVINLMIFLIIFVSVVFGVKWARECSSIRKSCPHCCRSCLKCVKKCTNCITIYALKNPVLIQFIISFFSLIATIIVLSNFKKADSLSTNLIKKYEVNGYDSKKIDSFIVMVIVFLIIILAGTVAYWILCKCYYNKLAFSNIKINNTNNTNNAGKNADVKVSIDSSKIGINSREPNLNLDTNLNTYTTNKLDPKAATDYNVNETTNQDVSVDNNINIEYDATKKGLQTIKNNI